MIIMSKINFTSIAEKYESTSLVQKSAAEELIELLNINSTDNILDVGCGTGSMTRKIKMCTRGKVVGVDEAKGMIKKAVEENEDKDIIFSVCDAKRLPFENEFDIIFCNSAFQWFKEPEEFIKSFNKALKLGGRVGIQAPATNMYCPNFVEAIKAVKQNNLTKNIFSSFKSPWFFLDTAEAYSKLFEEFGFKVVFSEISKISTKYTLEQCFAIFSSGAIAGYLNERCYEEKIDDEYIEEFKTIMKAEFSKQVNEEGMIDLEFNRIFLVGIKK
jgi:ubiquinone/menaquinone biosynthesis C-methylase UbiE